MKQFCLLALLILVIGCNSGKKKATEHVFPIDEKLVLSWNQFKNALSNSDITVLSFMINECVLSSICNIYTDNSRNLVSKDIFLGQCFSKIFDSTMISCIADSNKVSGEFDKNDWFSDDSCITKNKGIKNPRIANILIQLPYKHDDEGVSELLSFVETKDGYKLCGTLRIP